MDVAHDKNSCLLCRFGSAVFGHEMTKLLGKKWSRITLEQIQPLVKDLKLTIVGGLARHGYSEHDIDVVGDKRDVPVLVQRLNARSVNNLVHYCGPDADKHHHFTTLVNGFWVTFFGNRIYLKTPA